MDTFFARQPIFDRQGCVAGYELLYRRSPDAQSAVGEPDAMAAQVVGDAILGIDLAAVTDGVPAFVNAPRSLLLSGLLGAVDPQRIVVEVLETVPADDAVLAACVRLHAAGHTIALDDWATADARTALLPHATIVKVDVLDRPVDEVLASVAPFAQQHAIALVGRGALLRWLALMLAASYGRENGVSRELLREALVRARLCELLASADGPHRSGHLFLVGLFSRIDALLGIPLDDILRDVALPEPAADALLRRHGPYAPLLTLVEAWEEGRWTDVAAKDIGGNYADAIGWADAVNRHI